MLEAVSEDPRVLRLRLVGALDVSLVLIHLVFEGLEAAERLDLEDVRLGLQVPDALGGDGVGQFAELIAQGCVGLREGGRGLVSKIVSDAVEVAAEHQVRLLQALDLRGVASLHLLHVLLDEVDRGRYAPL